MSTYWGYKCLTCDVETDHWFNHGQECLRQLYALRKMMRDSGLDFGWIEVSIFGHGDPGEFLDDHLGHDVILANEYGGTEAIEQKRSKG